jgi:predicted nucleic acid-binding protein
LTLVIDASVALKWVLDEAGSDIARTLLAESLTAPALWQAEAANAIWKRARRGELSPAEASNGLAILTASVVVSIPIEIDLEKALSIAMEIDHPIYDCLYLAAAERLSTQLVTADARFINRVRATPYAPRVRALVA